MPLGINPGCILRSDQWFNAFVDVMWCQASLSWRYTCTKDPAMHFPKEEVLVWMVQSSSKGFRTFGVTITPVSMNHLPYDIQGQILWGQGNSSCWNGCSTIIWSSWVLQIASQRLYAGTHMMQFSYQKPHVSFLWLRNEKICGLDTYFSVAMGEWTL